MVQLNITVESFSLLNTISLSNREREREICGSNHERLRDSGGGREEV